MFSFTGFDLEALHELTICHENRENIDEKRISTTYENCTVYQQHEIVQKINEFT